MKSVKMPYHQLNINPKNEMDNKLMFRLWISEEKYFVCFWAFWGLDNFLRIYAANYPENVSQCTGKKDKNGKLIFEKDIVKITDKSSRKEPFIGVVEYTKTASFEANCNGFFMFLHDPKTKDNISDVEKVFCSSLREIEVIGNIYETPNLLEVKNGLVL